MKSRHLLFLCVSLLLLTACSNLSKSKIDNIDIKIPTSSILTMENTFGWFNDDYDYRVLEFDKANHELMLSNIKDSQKWKTLPLTPVIHMVTYGCTLKNGKVDAVIQDKKKQNLIPRIKNGYYYFLDRSQEKSFQEQDIEKFSPSSYNFTIAIYDIDTARLFYCEFNT